MTDRETFSEFFGASEPTVRRALVSRFGPELGAEATAEAFTIAWRNWDTVTAVSNQAGYVYRSGERWARRQRRPHTTAAAAHPVEDTYADPQLAAALAKLSPRQQQAVVLVQAFGMTHQEAADLLGCARSSIQNHVERGLRRLRKSLEVEHATR